MWFKCLINAVYGMSLEMNNWVRDILGSPCFCKNPGTAVYIRLGGLVVWAFRWVSIYCTLIGLLSVGEGYEHGVAVAESCTWASSPGSLSALIVVPSVDQRC